jgi:hypothetical protein
MQGNTNHCLNGEFYRGIATTMSEHVGLHTNQSLHHPPERDVLAQKCPWVRESAYVRTYRFMHVYCNSTYTCTYEYNIITFSQKRLWPDEHLYIQMCVRTYTCKYVRTYVRAYVLIMLCHNLYIRTYVRTYVHHGNVMSQLSDLKRAHMCTKTHVHTNHVRTIGTYSVAPLSHDGSTN